MSLPFVDADVLTIWVTALNEFLSSLDEGDRRKVESISGPNDLLQHVQSLHDSYHASRTARILDRLQPIFRWLHSYNECVKIYLNAAPQPFILLWGSLSLVIEVAARNHRALEQVVTCLEDISRHGPRFHHYTVRFVGGSYEQLTVALVKYHTELIGFCHDSIAFFRAGPRKNLFLSAFSPFSDKIEPRVRRIRELTAWIDQEAVVASGELRDKKYEKLNGGVQDILQRLNPQHLLYMSGTMLLTKSFQNLPPKPSQLFHGRVTELSLLQGCLITNKNQEALRTVCLHGMRGVGKTHLALEYAHGHTSDYPITLWVSAENSLKIQQSFSEIAHGMGIADNSMQHPDQLCGIVKQWLYNASKRGTSPEEEDSPNWLMIFDNVEELALLQTYWPQGSNGSIIITTTSKSIARYYAEGHQTIPVEPFNGETGTHMLLKLTGMDESAIEERNTANLIADALGNLPLALDLVGNYVLSLGKSLSSFWREYPRFETDFLFNPNLVRWTPTHFEESISRIWALHLYPNSLITNGHLNANSRRLINMLAFLDKDGTPLSLFQAATPEAMLFEGPDLQNEIENLDYLIDNPFKEVLALDGAIMNLRDRALVKLNDNTNRINCHRLVRQAVLKSMGHATKHTTFSQLVFYLNASFPTQEDGRPLHSKWTSCEVLASQVSALLESYSLYRNELGHPILLCEVAARCAWYFLESGRYLAARQMAEQSLDLCDSALRQGYHPGYSTWFVKDMTSHLYNVLATIERERPDHDFGVSLSKKVLDIRINNRRDSNPEDDMWIAAAEGNLAVSLMDCGRSTEAYEIILRLRQRDDMKANEDIYLRNTCVCLLKLGRLDEALEVNGEAINAAREKRGESSEQVAACYFDLANIHIQKGNRAAALDALQECLDRRNIFMPLHQVTAFTLQKIGDAAAMEGDYMASMHSKSSTVANAIPNHSPTQLFLWRLRANMSETKTGFWLAQATADHRTRGNRSEPSEVKRCNNVAIIYFDLASNQAAGVGCHLNDRRSPNLHLMCSAYTFFPPSSDDRDLIPETLRSFI
ncbi:hypothetical protein M434DRAFT_27437 [Hypoxylon sp. CO27-5]|nr:hypothetical protein M434DRAFT_27437 [Hypoxylon sp. CO27-5]